jgi:hypothetical protein
MRDDPDQPSRLNGFEGLFLSPQFLLPRLLLEKDHREEGMSMSAIKITVCALAMHGVSTLFVGLCGGRARGKEQSSRHMVWRDAAALGMASGAAERIELRERGRCMYLRHLRSLAYA